MQIRKLDELMTEGDAPPTAPWHCRVVQSEDCQSYVVWNDQSREALAVDPKREDWDAYALLASELKGYLWLGVIDTHTHADHVSAAARLSEALKAPLVMHETAPSRRVGLRVALKDACLPSKASPIRMLHTPGHTPDSLSVFWGPFIFSGDMILYGDAGRDDLPGGDAVAHYESMQALKAVAEPAMLLLPGHDHKGGRISTWATQLKVNASLTQEREPFVSEASAFASAPPRLLKESLKENFK
jgi:glyoxylase-like metal-dependent hydrolase (beta-lactamase superfamily II)